MGLHKIGVERAKLFVKTEQIMSEAVESEADDYLVSACNMLFGDDTEEDFDGIDDIINGEEIGLLDDYDTDDIEEQEIENILNSDKDIVGIDDILGLDDPDLDPDSDYDLL